MAVSIREVAARCGLSVATVSKALNGYADVGEGTRSRVLRIAGELGYAPNASARALKTRRSHQLALLLEDGALLNPAVAAAAEGFRAACMRLGYDVLLARHGSLGQAEGLCVVAGAEASNGGLPDGALPVAALGQTRADVPCFPLDQAGGERAAQQIIGLIEHGASAAET